MLSGHLIGAFVVHWAVVRQSLMSLLQVLSAQRYGDEDGHVTGVPQVVNEHDPSGHLILPFVHYEETHYSTLSLQVPSSHSTGFYTGQL